MKSITQAQDELIYETYKRQLAESETGYVVSWHIRFDTEIPTSKVNYYLMKRVKSGELDFITTKYCTRFFPKGTTPVHVGISDIIRTSIPPQNI